MTRRFWNADGGQGTLVCGSGSREILRRRALSARMIPTVPAEAEQKPHCVVVPVLNSGFAERVNLGASRWGTENLHQAKPASDRVAARLCQA